MGREDIPVMMFVAEDTSFYAAPIEDAVLYGTISNRLVRILVNTHGEACPDCGDRRWFLVHARTDMGTLVYDICWLRGCSLREYTEEDRKKLAYPVQLKNKTAVDLQTGESFDCMPGPVSVSWENTHGIENAVRVEWEGGNSHVVSLDEILFPSVESVNRLRLKDAYTMPDMVYVGMEEIEE